ncbi:UNVERIFIED_CONTAM: hypothetical protein FKN15_069506 [Acipenser sinensis]
MVHKVFLFLVYVYACVYSAVNATVKEIVVNCEEDALLTCEAGMEFGVTYRALLWYKVECCDKDLHAGLFRGSVHEAMTDLTAHYPDGTPNSSRLEYAQFGLKSPRTPTLRDWVAVESDSSDALKRDELMRMMKITENKFNDMKGHTIRFDIGNQEVEGPKQDLHSGVYGGSVFEPMIDLIGLLDTLIDSSGHILIPGINEAVAELTEEERKRYEAIEFDVENFKNKIGTDGLMYDTKEGILSHRWRYPSLSIHGIEGAFSASGSKTVIPAKVTAKFSIRQVPDMDPPTVEKQVPDMDPPTVEKQVTTYLNDMFAKRKTPNKLKVTMIIGAKPWLADVSDPLYVAGRRAVQKVFGVEPDLIREGGTIPVARTFQDVTGKSIIMLPIGGFDDGLHSQNEKMSRYNYIEGTKLFAAYLHEVSQINKS